MLSGKIYDVFREVFTMILLLQYVFNVSLETKIFWNIVRYLIENDLAVFCRFLEFENS